MLRRLAVQTAVIPSAPPRVTLRTGSSGSKFPQTAQSSTTASSIQPVRSAAWSGVSSPETALPSILVSSFPKSAVPDGDTPSSIDRASPSSPSSSVCVPRISASCSSSSCADTRSVSSARRVNIRTIFLNSPSDQLTQQLQHRFRQRQRHIDGQKRPAKLHCFCQ